MQCEPTQAEERIATALEKCKQHDEPALNVHFQLVDIQRLILLGQYETAQSRLDAVFGEIEDLYSPPDALVWWGLMSLMMHGDLEDWQNAAMLIPNISYQAELASDTLAWCICQVQAGRIALATGNIEEAQQLLEEAITVASDYHLSSPALMGWRYIAESELALGNLDMAEQICTRALDIAQKPHIGNLLAFYELSLTQAKILVRRYDPKEAGVLLERIWPNLVKSDYTPLIAEAAFQISQLYGQLGEGLLAPHREKYVTQQNNFLNKAKTLWQQQGNKARLAEVT